MSTRRSREAWLALFTAVLGVDASGCRNEGPPVSPAGAVDITPTPSVAAAASVASSAPDASAPLDATLAAGPADAGKLAASKRNDAGPSVAAVFQNDVPPVDLSELAQSSCGVSNNVDSDLKLGGGGSIVGLRSLGSPVDAGPAPRSDATLTIVSGGAPSDARILASLRPGMKSCFNQALRQDPNAPDGRVTLTITIAPNGEVNGVSASPTSLPDAGCVIRRVRNAEFDPPGGSGRTLVVNVDQKKVH